eukprot:1159740-Pelagomonas_calceolata.AAC.1
MRNPAGSTGANSDFRLSWKGRNTCVCLRHKRLDERKERIVKVPGSSGGSVTFPVLPEKLFKRFGSGRNHSENIS